VFFFRTNPLKPKPLSVHMAFNGNSSANSGTAAAGQTSALQVRRDTALSSAPPAFGPALPGTRFETLPPLAILFKPFQFLKAVCLNSVGLGFDNVPFHAGWELVEWKSTMVVSELHVSELVEICEEVEIEDSIEVVRPQIELDLGEGSSIHDVEPPVEVPGVVSTVVVEEEEDSSVEVLSLGRR